MLLISKFKDYYDYMIGITGIDRKVVFNRGNINHNSNATFKVPGCYHWDKKAKAFTVRMHIYHVLSICGKRFVLIESKAKEKDGKVSLRLITKHDLKNKDIVDDLIYFSRGRDYFYYKAQSAKDLVKLYDSLHGIYEKDLVDISKKISSPIFLIDPRGRVYDRSPILKEIKGVSGMLDAKNLFNEISFFIANILPMQRPMIQVSDATKIGKAGFDLKTSFRNMER